MPTCLLSCYASRKSTGNCVVRGRRHLALVPLRCPMSVGSHLRIVLEVSSMTHSIALLRAQMQFLLDNLQIYLHVDVIEAQYSLLVDAINKARAFEAIKLAHDR